MTAPKYYTRKQYMDPTYPCTHHQYYASIVKELGIDYSTFHRLDEIRTCFEAGDVNLNRIPLQTWDAWGYSLIMNPTTHLAFKRRGDTVCPAGIVCLLKTAARIALDES